jgi:hypothetical protein
MEIHPIPAHHMGLYQEPRVNILAEKLGACLEKAQSLACRSGTGGANGRPLGDSK